jgi:NADH dehydrogenase
VILLAGGTGRLGTLVVSRLTAVGEPVRVLTRDTSRAAALRGPLVDVVLGDVRDPSTLLPALSDVRTVVSAVQGFAGPGGVTPESVDRDGNANLVAAAKAEGSDVVLVSVVGASADSAMELFRMKAAAEENLINSGVPWTIVRASGFLELYLDLMRRSAGKAGRPLVFGHGQNPIDFVRVADVADAVVRATIDPALRCRTLNVCGTNLTLNAVAAMVQQELGSDEKAPRHVPRSILRVLAASRVFNNSAVSRQASAALVMDSTDMTASGVDGWQIAR